MKKLTQTLLFLATLLNVVAMVMSLIQKHYFQAFNSFTMALMFGFIWVFGLTEKEID